MYDIEIYEDKNGNCEIEEYLRKLKNGNSKDDRIKLKKIRAYINLLSEYGFNLGKPYIKHIDDEIWELRPLKNRILFVSVKNNKFVLLSIFMKKTPKTPKREIEKARKLFKDYIERCDDNE